MYRRALTKQRPASSCQRLRHQQHGEILHEHIQEDDDSDGTHASEICFARTVSLLAPSAEVETQEGARQATELNAGLPIRIDGRALAGHNVAEAFLESGQAVEGSELRDISTLPKGRTIRLGLTKLPSKLSITSAIDSSALQSTARQ